MHGKALTNAIKVQRWPYVHVQAVSIVHPMTFGQDRTVYAEVISDFAFSQSGVVPPDVKSNVYVY